MTSSKSTKRALLTSALAILMCVAMLIGTTFAWFTDTASTAVNKIQAGTLDVQLLMWDGSGYVDISNATRAIFGTYSIAQNNNAETLWEPGKTQVAYLAIKNNGNLALKYKVVLDVTNESNNLYEVMEYAITPDATNSTPVTAWTSGNSVVEGAQEVANDVSLAVGATHYFALSVHMKEEAGNTYQNGKVDFDLTVYATQDTVENDSFNNQYDKYAQYGERTVKNEAPVVGTNGTYGLVDSGRDNINTKNVTYSIPAGNYDGGFYAQHFGINSTFDGNGSTFKSFQLNCGYVPTTEASTLVVSNLNVNGDLIITASSNNVVIYNCTAKHISVLGVKNDITVTIDGCKITGTPIANVVGNNKYGVYITRPVAEGTAKVSIINSELSNIKGHAIAVNSSGATCDFTITGNKFTNYGLDGEANRAAFKIWGDGVLAPTSNVGGNLNEQATVLANAIKANNTFNTGNNCVVAEFYGATLGLN